MDSYLVLRLLHIVSAIVLVGTGFGIAFFMFMVSRSGNVQAIAVTARHVVLADWLFTTPAIIIQFISGILLMIRLEYSFTSSWFLAVMVLFVLIGACWIPVVFIQYRLRAMAQSRIAINEISPAFRRLMRLWTVLGTAAFAMILMIIWLMVFRPLSTG